MSSPILGLLAKLGSVGWEAAIASVIWRNRFARVCPDVILGCHPQDYDLNSNIGVGSRNYRISESVQVADFKSGEVERLLLLVDSHEMCSLCVDH